MTPPLPSSLLSTVLSQLLPPSVPLPTSLLSGPLLDRLTFLPPDLTDIDAHLTPHRSSVDQPLSARLERLALGVRRGDVEYAFDGEGVVARVVLRSSELVSGFAAGGKNGGLGSAGVDQMGGVESQGMNDQGGTEGEGAEIWFALDPEQEWKFHLVQLPSSSTLTWSCDPPPHPPTAAPLNRDPDSAPNPGAAEAYWAGFTPPSTSTQLPNAPAVYEGDTEEEYWRQYDGGERLLSADPSRGPSRRPSRQPSGVDVPRLSGKTRLSLNAVDEGLMAVPASPQSGPTEVGSGREDGDGEGLLRQKLEAKIMGLIRGSWAEFSRAAQGREDVLEEKGMIWLRIGRGVVDAQTSFGRAGDQLLTEGEEETLRVKLDLLADIHGILSDESEFWGLLEEAIRIPNRGGYGDATS